MYFLKISIRAWMLMVVLATLSIATSTASAATSAQEHPTSSCGTWQVAPGPNVGSINNDLSAVAAISSSDIWTVGYTYSSQVLTPSHTLTIHWNGSRWSIVPSPNVGSTSNFLSAVAAVSSNDVWAVGSYYTDIRGSGGKNLIEHWNGTSWSIVASPDAGSRFNGLTGVAVVSTSDVWAVGNYSGESQAKTLIEHWNGTSWSIVASPSPGASDNALDQVTVASARDIWTVGTLSMTNGHYQTLIEHWNGTSWSVVPSPNVGSYSNFLRGVAAVSPQDVWAVGYFAGNIDSTLTEHWNGTNWSVVPSPNPETSSNDLSGVAIVSSSDVWAVGSGSDISSPSTTLVEHWNGSSWSAVPSRNRQPPSDGLGAVTVISANDIWAVGFHILPNFTIRTLFEHYC